MMSAGCFARGVAFAVWFVVAAAGVCRADEVWRIAGTMNGWSTRDEGWALEPVEGKAGVFAIERRIDPGEYLFKFVRGGDWGEGHLGRVGRPLERRLEEPGENIPLTVPAEAAYRITLDTEEARWTFEPVDLRAPIPVIRFRGVPTLGRMFEIDMRESLTKHAPVECGAVIVSPGTVHRIRRAKDNSLRYGVIPSDSGKFLLNITLIDGREEDAPRTERQMEIFIAQRFFIELEFVGNDGAEFARREIIWPQGNDVYRAIIEIPEDGILNAADIVIQQKTDDLVLVRSNGAVEAGTYLVEIADGEVTLHDEPGAPAVLHRGNWTKFELALDRRKLPPAEVYLTGDFNGWAMPGHPEAIRMTSRSEARFDTILDLEEGSHRYQYVYEGAAYPDPGNTKRAEAPDGTEASVVVVGPSPEDFGAAREDHVNTAAIRHDPETRRYLRPISRGLGLADVAITTLPDDAERVVCYAVAADEEVPSRTRTIEVPMRRGRDASGFDVWRARLRTGLAEFTYSFAVFDGDAEHTTTTYRAALGPDPLQIPDWAKGAVWYQVFTDRFRNGNPLNDPHGEGVFLKEWNSDWYEITEEEARAWRERYGLEPGAPFPERTGGPLYHVVYDRRYGGDLQGVEEKLDELRDLGVTALYFNPVFEAESMHKYDATDYRHIDDNFGTPASEGRVPAGWEAPAGETLDPETWVWTPADRYFVQEFLPAVHSRGMRVIVDAVFNHTGREFFAFRDLLERGAESAYAAWYDVEFDAEGNVKEWAAWDGPSGWLPKFRQTSDGDLVAPVKRHLMDVTRRWMDPNGDGDPSDGVDGWRLDVPLDIGGAQGAPFWRDWRRLVKSVNPDAVIIAEIWGEEEARQYLAGDHFDTQMHYPFAMAVTEWLAVDPGMTSRELGATLSAAFNEPPQTNLIHQNLFGSHDTDRYVSKLLNPGREYDAGNRIQDGALEYREERPPDEVYTLSLVGVGIQATYLGAPMIYYGDEYGMWGADDPSDRKPLPWPDTGRNRNPTDGPLLGLRDRYASWFTLRRDPMIGPILRYGDVRHLESGDPGVFAFVRSLNGREVYVVANRNERSFDASGLLPEEARATRVGPVETKYWVVGE